MARFVNIENISKKVVFCKNIYEVDENLGAIFSLIENILSTEPTADVEKVVRCRDCKLWEENSCKTLGQCTINGSTCKECHYCGWAKKKEVGNENL